MSLFNNVKQRAAEKGLSISALEKEAGLGNGVIGAWKSVNPNINSLVAVSRVLETTVDDLIKEPVTV